MYSSNFCDRKNFFKLDRDNWKRKYLFHKNKIIRQKYGLQFYLNGIPYENLYKKIKILMSLGIKFNWKD